MYSDTEDNELYLLARKRYYLVTLVLIIQTITATILFFTKGWALIIFNAPSLFGAFSLWNSQAGDVEYNRKGTQMYLMGFIKTIFMLFLLFLASYRTNSLEQMTKKDESKIAFYHSLEQLCLINSLCDLAYSFIGILILQYTQDIIKYLTDRDVFEPLSPFFANLNANKKFISIECKNFRI